MPSRQSWRRILMEACFLYDISVSFANKSVLRNCFDEIGHGELLLYHQNYVPLM